MVDAVPPAPSTPPLAAPASPLAAPVAPKAPAAASTHTWRGRDVVFVDPLDASAPHWWPAMIVPTDEIDATMGCTQLAADEYLVKYFEDCKYSTVRGSELRAFDTGQTPFTAFAADNPAFAKDKAIRAALSFLKTGHVHAKFQWHRWQTGSDALQLPFALVTAADSLATATDAEVPVGPEPPSHAGPKTPPEPEPGAATASDTASVVASDEDAAARQTESPPPLPPPEESVPGVASPEPPESSGDVASSQPATPQPTQARARRTRHQKQPSTNGTPKRSRVQPTRHQRQLSKPQAQKGSMPVTPASGTVSPEETPPAMVTVIKELEDVQEEYRVFHTLVRRAARDLWSEMGNDWPPNPASSTRYGKRRKVV